MSRLVGKLRAVLRLDSTQFNQDVGRQRSRLAGLMSFARRAFAPLAAAAAGMASVQSIRRTLGFIDAQAKLARSLGTTVQSMQVLSRAAELAGIDQSRLESSSRDLQRRLSQAAASGGPAAAALDRLGLSAEGLMALPLDERILQINTALEANVTSAERAAVAGALFGEEGSLAMTRLDPATLRQANEEIAQFGRVVSGVESAAIEKANDAISLMGMSARAFGTDMVIALAPILDWGSRGVAVLVRGVRTVTQFFRDWVFLVASFYRFLFEGSSLLQGYVGIARNVWSAFGRVLSAIGGLIGGLRTLFVGMRSLVEQSGSFGAVWEHLKAIAAEVAPRIATSFSAMGLRIRAAFQDVAGQVAIRFGEIIASGATWAARMADIAIGAKDAMVAAFSALPAAIGSLMYQAATAAVGGVESLINGVILRVNDFLTRINATIARLPDWARRDFTGFTPLGDVNLDGPANPFADAQSVGSASRDAFLAAQGQTDFGAAGTGLQDRGAGLSRSAVGSVRAARNLEASNRAPLASVAALTAALAEARAQAAAADEAAENLGVTLDNLGDSALETSETLGGGAGGGAAGSIADAADTAGDALDVLRERVSGLAAGLSSAIMQGKKFGEIVSGALLKVAETWMTQGIDTILQQLFGLGQGGKGNFLSQALSIFLPKRALGGGVRAGQIYQVNEDTPRSEWMFSSGNGGVLNHGQMQSAVGKAIGSGGAGSDAQTVSISIDARGAQQGVAEQIAAGIRRELPSIIIATRAGIGSKQARGHRV